MIILVLFCKSECLALLTMRVVMSECASVNLNNDCSNGWYIWIHVEYNFLTTVSKQYKLFERFSCIPYSLDIYESDSESAVPSCE